MQVHTDCGTRARAHLTKRLLHITFRWTRLVIWIGIASLMVAGLAITYRIRLANQWEDRAHLPAAPAYGKGDRIIIFAPHCDDETLGCGGLIATSVANGARVRIVLVTNGDGYKLAIGKAYKTLRITPQRCIDFAYRRQQETLRAAAVLGVGRDCVTFLGYPDRGVDQLWSRYWESDQLFTSPHTKACRSPYVNSFTPGAPYCGESLLRDLQTIIRTEKPTDIYVPHPCDNHPDHYATYCFVAAAVEQLRAEGDAKRVNIHTYIVHRGDWPTPRGDHPEQVLAPPCGLAKAGTKWCSLALPPDVEACKRRAICAYKTQIAVSKSFLMSFARANEIFGDVPVRRAISVQPGAIKVDGNIDDWARMPPAVVDAVGDYVVAGMTKSGDVRAVYLARDNNDLYIRVDCVRHVSKRIKYYVNLRGLGSADANDVYSIAVRLSMPASPRGTMWAARGNSIELAVPIRKLSFDRSLFIQVQTKLFNLTVDNTGWREVQLQE